MAVVERQIIAISVDSHSLNDKAIDQGIALYQLHRGMFSLDYRFLIRLTDVFTCCKFITCLVYIQMEIFIIYSIQSIHSGNAFGSAFP